MLTNDNYFCKATGIADKWRFDGDSVNLAVMPMFHMAGSGWALVGMCEGARTVVLRDVGAPEITEAGLIAYARDRLAGYKLPKSVVFADTLPRNPSGKLLKRELRDPCWRGVDRRIG